MHVTEALSFLHSAAKLVHMDLSPENIWITTDGSWKIAGFGFSQPGEGSNGTFKTFINEGNQVCSSEPLRSTRRATSTSVPQTSTTPLPS